MIHPCYTILVTWAGRRRVEVLALILFFLFFISLLICKINLSLCYLKHLDSRVVRTWDFESVNLGLTPSGCLLSCFFSFFLLEVNKHFSSFS